AQRLGGPAECRIPGQVAVAVVDQLEVVDVDQGDVDQAAGAGGPGQLLPQPLVERAVVEQAGQRVAVDLRAEILVQLGVAHGQRRLASDRLQKGDVAPRPGAGRSVVGDLDQTDRTALDGQR